MSSLLLECYKTIYFFFLIFFLLSLLFQTASLRKDVVILGPFYSILKKLEPSFHLFILVETGFTRILIIFSLDLERN